MSASTRASNTAEAQRKRRACVNYGQNAAGKWVRKTAWRACDYTDAGRLREFDGKEAFLKFEEERRMQGHCQAHYEKELRDTVPKEQLALGDAITHAIKKDGNESRVQLQRMEEGIHERHDEHRAALRQIRAHQRQEGKQQRAILEKKQALAEKQKARNDAFASRVEAGDGTPLEEKKLRLKILAEDIRREEAEAKLEKQRERARELQVKKQQVSRRKASAASVGAPSKRRRSVDKSMPDGESPGKKRLRPLRALRNGGPEENGGGSPATMPGLELARAPSAGAALLPSCAAGSCNDAAPHASPRELEDVAGRLEDSGLTAEAVRRRLAHFPETAAVPIWRATWGRLVRLPEAPSNGQMLVYCPSAKLHHYMALDAVKKTTESDAVLTAMARVRFAAVVTREHPKERRSAFNSLLLDYHPDKLNGDRAFSSIVNYIQTEFGSESDSERD